jgi:hypothetical protein
VTKIFAFVITCGLFVALTSCSNKAAAGSTRAVRFEPTPGTNEVNLDVVQGLLSRYRAMSDGQLSSAMDETDYNKRAAASYVRLERANISPGTEGVSIIQDRYLSGPGDRAYGFSLLGSVASLGMAKSRISRIVLQFVESHPQSPDCDSALWALGETGDNDAIVEFLRIATAPDRYGPRARERSFCCMSQCGRYSASTRFEQIPRILEIAQTVSDEQTQAWCMMALHDMAPGLPYSTIEQWQDWWDEQSRLRGSAFHN